MILPKQRDPRFITIRRGGSLTDRHHHLLALWAAACAEHVLPIFEADKPQDLRPRQLIEMARAWTRGDVSVATAHKAAFLANAAAREATHPAAKYAALAAGQAVAVAHVAAHELGAAAYAIKAVQEASATDHQKETGRSECAWQRGQLPGEIRDLVLDDQKMRNEICWSVFDF